MNEWSPFGNNFCVVNTCLLCLYRLKSEMFVSEVSVLFSGKDDDDDGSSSLFLTPLTHHPLYPFSVGTLAVSSFRLFKLRQRTVRSFSGAPFCLVCWFSFLSLRNHVLVTISALSAPVTTSQVWQLVSTCPEGECCSWWRSVRRPLVFTSLNIRWN